jgi:hypothetical protein
MIDEEGFVDPERVDRIDRDLRSVERSMEGRSLDGQKRRSGLPIDKKEAVGASMIDNKTINERNNR